MYLNKCGPDDQIPWTSLKYLIGEAMYDGRVTDNYDRRIMMTYLDEYMGDFVFDTNQVFYFSRVGYDFIVPPLGIHDNYVKATQEIPQIYIGLHFNAEIDFFTQASINLWSNLILQKTSSSKSGGKGVNREDFILDLGNKIKSILPSRFDFHAISRKYPIKGSIEVNLSFNL